MSGAHLILRLVHIGFGSAVLILMWVPIATRKGGRSHRRTGRMYAWAGRVVIATAVGSCLWALADPVGFIGPDDVDGALAQTTADVRFYFGLLGVLATIALTAVERGMFLTKRDPPHSARRWLTTVAAVAGVCAMGLGGWGLAGLTTGIDWRSLIRIGVAVLGLAEALQTLAVSRLVSPTRTERIAAHLEAMLGSGAAFYTAFAVLGFRRLLTYDAMGGGLLGFLPWFAPFVVVAIATSWWKRRVTGATATSAPIGAAPELVE